MADDKSKLRYPRIYRRIQAAIIDSIIITVVFFIAASSVTSLAMHGVLKAAIVVAPIFILEPGLVATMGGTIGHQLLGLRIQNRETGANLNILFAVIRFIVKSILGLPSFIFVLVTKRHQAIHDMVSSSVVVIKNPTGEHEFAEQKEREIYQQNFVYPVWYWRVAIIVIYSLVSIVLFNLIMSPFLTEDCIVNELCTSFEFVFLLFAFLIWLAIIAAIMVYGWIGKLFGARRKSLDHTANQNDD